ncbi:MAG: hypothetical protein IJ593_03240 [Lachnospiraceae bacterium]|nr:hypothetical protein [Lachnospiraceae bacterium]
MLYIVTDLLFIKILKRIDDNESSFDIGVLPKMFKANQVNSYKYDDNWKLIEKENDVK